MLEKISFVTAVVVLLQQGRMHRSDLVFPVVDLLLCILFAAAYLKTRVA
jgi:hypothetical protein